jgi:hypothetical protein
MPRQTISARAWSAAPPSTIYSLLRDGATWPAWSPLGSFELLEEGPGGGDSLGAIRVFHTGRTHTVERVVTTDPGRRFSYELVRGIPIRHYRADIDLAERDGGTEIHWHSSFDAKIPGTGTYIRRTLQRFIQQCVDGLAAYAPTVNDAPASETA